jgi:hypothetical protein
VSNSILFKTMLFKIIGSIILIIIAVSFFKGRNIFNGFTKIKTNSNVEKGFVKIILPIAFIFGAMWFSGRPILDYVVKDYSIKVGVLKKINSPYNYVSTEEFFIEGDKDPYYLPKGILKSEETGIEYRFKYAKRSRIILEIEENKK